MIAHYDYALPPERIAQSPIEPRDAARLLVSVGGTVAHRHVRDLPSMLRPNDVIVVNDTLVLPARLLLRKATGGVVEVLLLERAADGWWSALVRPSRKVAEGVVLRAGDDLAVFFGPSIEGGRRRVELRGTDGAVLTGDDETAALERYGDVPLPPYITEPLDDPQRYQTVYAREPGSVAAPTAGLHFTTELLDACRDAGAQVVAVELVVGLDTFRPIAVERLDDHVMHSERYRVPEATMAACAAAHANGGRVIVVGTTALRALESAASRGERSGRTDLFIRPGFAFAVADVLLTNFHLPRSTLLVMIESFTGPRWRDLYAEAVRDSYRFLSFGDAMLIDRASTSDSEKSKHPYELALPAIP